MEGNLLERIDKETIKEISKTFIFVFCLQIVYVLSLFGFGGISSFLLFVLSSLFISLVSSLFIHKQIWKSIIVFTMALLSLIFYGVITDGSEFMNYLGLSVFFYVIPSALFFFFVLFLCRFYYKLENKKIKIILLILPFILIFIFFSSAQIAVLTSNSFFCNLAYSPFKGECFAEVAIKTENLEICADTSLFEVYNINFQNYCFRKIFLIGLNRGETCENLYSNTIGTPLHLQEQYCLQAKVTHTGDSSLCSVEENRHLIEICERFAKEGIKKPQR